MPSNLKKESTRNSNAVKPKISNEVMKLLNDLNKKYGQNAVTLGTKFMEDRVIERILTGSIDLDIKLGGGIPIGRLTQLSGAFSSTKTTQAVHIVREAQKMGLVCCWGDAEGTSDEEYFKALGVDPELLLYTRPDGLEEWTQMMLDYQKSKVVHLAVWDTVEATSPTKELESSMEDSIQMGVKQKLIAEFCRKFQMGNNRLVREGKRPFTVLAVNQLRERIGSYGDLN